VPFRFERLDISDLILIETTVFEDERGSFSETYKHSDFAAFGIAVIFTQDAFSRSRKGVLRGLHYQKEPKAQGKLVRVVKGEVLDVAVDIRRSSPTYGRWVAIHLSSENRRGLYIPPGFAHGFCVLTEVAEVLYKMTQEHDAEHERGVLWSDPDLAISWPIPHPTLSSRDARLPRLRDAEANF